jgi:hypothetical protein
MRCEVAMRRCVLLLAVLGSLLWGVAPALAQSAQGVSRARLVLGVEWRGLALARHFSNGPGGHVGVSLLRDHLVIGIVAFARPGPINPETFSVRPADGVRYKGQDKLALRSDGAFVGVYVAPAFRLGKWVHVELPVAVGQAAFGFYMTGDNRKTPDGRRVSKWENELLDARDSSVCLGLEVGARVALEVTPWLRPFIAAHYFHTFGFDTYVRRDYNGPSLALGVQLTTPGSSR